MEHASVRFAGGVQTLKPIVMQIMMKKVQALELFADSMGVKVVEFDHHNITMEEADTVHISPVVKHKLQRLQESGELLGIFVKYPEDKFKWARVYAWYKLKEEGLILFAEKSEVSSMDSNPFTQVLVCEDCVVHATENRFNRDEKTRQWLAESEFTVTTGSIH